MKKIRLLTGSALLLIGFNSYAFEAQGVLDWSGVSVKSFAVHGNIETVSVHAGEMVKKGQLLAQLDLRSFVALIEKNKGAIQQLEPLIFDARIELSHAEELFERTVLSEIELQKKQGVLQELEARQVIARESLKLVQIQYEEAQLKAPFDARLVRVDMIPGLTISADNMSIEKIILAQTGVMQARVLVTVEQAVNINLGQKVKVKINTDEYEGTVISSVQQVAQSEQYVLTVEFKHDAQHHYLAGQKVSVMF